VGYVVTDL